MMSRGSPACCAAPFPPTGLLPYLSRRGTSSISPTKCRVVKAASAIHRFHATPEQPSISGGQQSLLMLLSARRQIASLRRAAKYPQRQEILGVVRQTERPPAKTETGRNSQAPPTNKALSG